MQNPKIALQIKNFFACRGLKTSLHSGNYCKATLCRQFNCWLWFIPVIFCINLIGSAEDLSEELWMSLEEKIDLDLLKNVIKWCFYKIFMTISGEVYSHWSIKYTLINLMCGLPDDHGIRYIQGVSQMLFDKFFFVIFPNHFNPPIRSRCVIRSIYDS